MTTTRTITITKEIEEKMRKLIEEAANAVLYDDAYGEMAFYYPDKIDEDSAGSFLEANELLRTLGIEPSEDFAKQVLEARIILIDEIAKMRKRLK